MRIEQIFIAIVIFGVVFTLGINMYVEQADKYGYSDDSFLNLTGVIQQKTNYTDDLEGYNQPLQVQGEDTEASTIKSGFSKVQGMWGTVAMGLQAIPLIGKQTALIPDYVIAGILAILGILGVVFIIYMIMRFKPF